MNMSVLQFSALASGWASRLHDDVREYYNYESTPLKKKLIEGDIANVRDALDLLEQELQKVDIFVDAGKTPELPRD